MDLKNANKNEDKTHYFTYRLKKVYLFHVFSIKLVFISLLNKKKNSNAMLDPENFDQQKPNLF